MIQIEPSKDDKEKIRKWMGTARYLYNKVLDAVENQGMRRNEFHLRNRWSLEKSILKDSAMTESEKTWLLQTPKHIRDGAVRDLMKAYDAEFAKKKLNPKHYFKMTFKTKKKGSSISLDPIAFSKASQKYKTDALNSFRIYTSYLKDPIAFSVRDGKDIDFKNIKMECRLSMSKTGKFYIHVPYDKPMSAQASENQGGEASTSQTAKVASVDPGVSPFMCVWSPEVGQCYQIGKGDKKWLEKWVLKANNVLELSKKHPYRSIRSKYAKAYQRLRVRINDRIKDMHIKTALFLVKTFDTILYPDFRIKSMVEKNLKRKIRKRTVRDLYNWSFYKFKTILQSKAEEHGKTFILCNEAYTSKTCTNCGNLNRELSGRKVYDCGKCHVVYDRDVGGARNIYLKNH